VKNSPNQSNWSRMILFRGKGECLCNFGFTIYDFGIVNPNEVIRTEREANN